MAKKKIQAKSLSSGEMQLLRHLIATIAYRTEKVIRNSPEGFAGTKLGESTRTPIQILAHINDLFDWAGHLVRGEHIWNTSQPKEWSAEVERFYKTLKNFDKHLSGTKPLLCDPKKLIQGPIADALTHVGQLAMIRRIAGSPVRGENYYRAEITSGRVGRVQSKKRTEFD